MPERTSTNFVRKAKDGSEGVMIIDKADIDKYLQKFNAIQLRENKKTSVNNEYPYYNFGESKGLEFQRILIYPTQPMWNWIINNDSSLKNKARLDYMLLLHVLRTVLLLYGKINNLVDCQW